MSADLPGFVVLNPRPEGPAAARRTGPAASCRRPIKGVPFRSKGDPILNVASPPRHRCPASARDDRPRPCGLNRRHLRRAVADPEIEARIAAYELAYRMQTSAPELDGPLAGESAGDARPLRSEARSRRRSRIIACSPGDWSSAAFGSSTSTMRVGTTIPTSPAASRPSAARPTGLRPRSSSDLKRRGLARRHPGRLGRRVRPDADGRVQRRARPDRSVATTTPRRYTIWMAGGGVKARPDDGIDRRPRLSRHRRSGPRPRRPGDDLAPARPRPHPADVSRSQGRDFRLTDVSGAVVSKLLA